MSASSNTTTASAPRATDPAVNRVVALDALRGFDMFWIIGGQELVLATSRAVADPPPAWLSYHLDHPAWLGFSAWDLIMPLFLFVVGAAMPFSFARRLGHGTSRLRLSKKIIRRAAILFVLGMVVQGHLLDFNLSTLHVFANTLQAIAVGYLVSAFAMLFIGVAGQIALMGLLLIGYWLLLTQLPFGGHPAGTLLPDANVALAVDEYVLGRFRDGTAYPWVLSGMTFSASVLLGVQAGHLLRSTLAPLSKFIGLAAAGLLCLTLGWAWAQWLHFPLIKHIWTSSMVLWAGGWSFLLLALFYLLIDVMGWRRWAFPLVVIGANALTIYVATHLISFSEIARTLVGGLAAHCGAAGPAIIAFTSLLLAWLVVYHLYRQRIFLRV
jgi:predicted acyltransferase